MALVPLRLTVTGIWQACTTRFGEALPRLCCVLLALSQCTFYALYSTLVVLAIFLVLYKRSELNSGISWR